MINKIPVLYSLIVLVLLFSCDNEPYEGEFFIEDNSCALAIEATANAFQNYNQATEDNLNAFCLNYRDALESQIEICGDENGILQLTIDELGDCIFENGLCDEAILATQIAHNNYISAPDEEFEELCNVYKQAVQYQISVCGDDGTLQGLVEELLNCEPLYVATIGTWILVSWTTNISKDIDNDGLETGDYLTEIDCYNNETIIFNSNGTGTIFSRSIAEITYTPVAGSDSDVDYFVNCNEINEETSFSWIQIGNTIIFTFSDGTTFNYFRNLNTLFVVIDDGFLATSTVDGISVIAEPVTYVYVKL